MSSAEGELLTLYPDRWRGEEEDPVDRIREVAISYFQSQELCDIEVQVAGGESIQAHRLVLVTESEYFRALLCGQFTPVRTVDLSRFSPIPVRIVLDYLYTNICTLNEGSLSEVLEVAAYLQVPALVKEMSAEIADRLVSSNAFAWWARASSLELPVLVAAARAAALRGCHGGAGHGGAGLGTETLRLLPVELMCEIASSGKLCVGEETIGRAVETWLQLHGLADEEGLRSALQRGAEGRARRRRLHSGRGLVLMIGGHALGQCSGGCYESSTAVECYDSRSGVWSDHAHLNHARRDAAAVTHDGDVYVLGGKNGYQYAVDNTIEMIGSVELFEQYSEHERWQSEAPLQVPRSGAAAASFDGALYCLGGEVNMSPMPDWPDTSVRLTSHVEQYDPAAGRWVTASAMPRARKDFAVAVLGDRLYVMGGLTVTDESGVREEARHGYPELRAARGLRPAYYVRGITEATPSVEYFDGHAWHSAPSLSRPYVSCSAITYEGKIYLTGVHARGGDYSSSVECYDPSVGRWVELTATDTKDVPRMDDEDEQSPPRFPSGRSAGILDGKMCILQRSRDGLEEFWCFDPEDACWESLPRTDGSFKHRRGVCAVVLQ